MFGLLIAEEDSSYVWNRACTARRVAGQIGANSLSFYRKATERRGWQTTMQVVEEADVGVGWSRAVFVAKKRDKKVFVLLERCSIERRAKVSLIHGLSEALDF